MIRLDCPVCEDGELTFRLFNNSDGDVGVVNGIRSWVEVECANQSCNCAITPDQLDTLYEQAIREGENDDPPDLD